MNLSNISTEITPQTIRNTDGDHEIVGQSSDGIDGVLSINLKSQKLGGCFYSYRDRKLWIMEEIKTFDPEVQLENVIRQMRPDKVLINASVNRAILDKLENDSGVMHFQLKLRPSNEFNDSTNNQINCLLDRFKLSEFDSKVLVRTPYFGYKICIYLHANNKKRGTITALVKHIESHLLIEESTEEIEDLICFVELFILDDYMCIDEDSMAALQVLPLKNGATNSSTKSSLFEFISFTCSEQGKRRLYSWFLRPLANKGKIVERLQTVTILSQEYNTETVELLRGHMRQVPNFLSIMNLLRSGKWDHNTWLRLNKFIVESFEIYHNLRKLNRNNSDISLLEAMLFQLNIDCLTELKGFLEETLDIQLTRDLQKPTILDGVDPNLDNYRKAYNEMDQVLQGIARELVSGLPAQLSSSLNVAYIPQLGFLIQLESSTELENFAVNSGWCEIFRSPTNIYFKNNDMEEMDSYYGDTYSLMCDCEIELVQGLSTTVLNHLEILTVFLDNLATLDCFLSLTKAANVFNYTIPEMCEETVLQIEESRHPMYEHLTTPFISNDIRLGSNEDERVMMITGANLSGKSIYLSQVGLIVFLAHIGSFVPARKAKIGICDRLLTRMVSRETLSKHNSTFMIDVQQMEKCLRLMTAKSLLLIDEFGKGTDMNDGPALFGAVLKYLSNLGPDCPRSFTATHFHDLFTDNAIKEYLDLRNTIYYNMEVVLNRKPGYETDSSQEISYLFQLKKGIANKSFGIYCAQLSGIPTEIIERAQLFVNLLENGENVVEFCNQLTLDEARDLVLLESIIMKFMRWDLKSCENMADVEVRKRLNLILSTNDEN